MEVLTIDEQVQARREKTEKRKAYMKAYEKTEKRKAYRKAYRKKKKKVKDE